jgi:hypothetical protein
MVRVTNPGLLLLAVYLIMVGLSSFGIFLFGLERVMGLLALVAGILLLSETLRH